MLISVAGSYVFLIVSLWSCIVVIVTKYQLCSTCCHQLTAKLKTKDGQSVL